MLNKPPIGDTHSGLCILCPRSMRPTLIQQASRRAWRVGKLWQACCPLPPWWSEHVACVTVGLRVPTSAPTGVTTPSVGEAAVAESGGRSSGRSAGAHFVLHVSTHPTSALASVDWFNKPCDISTLIWFVSFSAPWPLGWVPGSALGG